MRYPAIITFIVLLGIGLVYAQPEQEFVFIRSDVGFDTACSYYKITNFEQTQMPTPKLLSVQINDKDDGGYTDGIKEVVGQAINPRWEYYFIDQVDCSEKAWVEDITCQDVYDPKNDTMNRICEDKGGYVTTPKTCYVETWARKDDPQFLTNVKIDALGSKLVRFCADLEYQQDNGIWSVAIDHIPEFDNIAYDKYAWWNNTFNYRFMIYKNATNETTSFAINESTVVAGNHTIWTRERNATSYLYSTGLNGTGVLWIANETHGKQWYFENNATTSGNHTHNIWTPENVTLMLHMGETEGTTIYDVSENFYNFTLNGGTTHSSTNCAIDRCLFFAGDNDNAVNATPLESLYDSNMYSISFWVYRDASGVEDWFFTVDPSNTDTWCRGNAGNDVTCFSRTSSDLCSVTGGSVPSGELHLITLTVDVAVDDKCYLWVDGTQVASDDAVGNPPTPDDMYIGEEGGAGHYWFDGWIDDFRWYLRELNESEIQEMEEPTTTTTTTTTPPANATDSDCCPHMYRERPQFFCADNETLASNVTHQLNINGNITNYVVYTTEHCQYACDNRTNTCVPPPIDQYTIYFLALCAIVIIIGIIAYLWRRI
jgi:hypothetical protein